MSCRAFSWLATKSNFVHHTYRNYIDDYKVAIVCSARSGSTKALGTTNLLLRAASEALRRTKPAGSSASGTATPVTRSLFGVGGGVANGHGSDYGYSQSPPTSPQPRSRSSRSSSPQPLFGFTPLAETEVVPEFHVTVDLVRNEHLVAARETIKDPRIIKELEEEIDRDCEWLRSFLFAAKVCLILCSHDRYLTTVPSFSSLDNRRNLTTFKRQYNRAWRKDGMQSDDSYPPRPCQCQIFFSYDGPLTFLTGYRC